MQLSTRSSRHSRHDGLSSHVMSLDFWTFFFSRFESPPPNYFILDLCFVWGKGSDLRFGGEHVRLSMRASLLGGLVSRGVADLWYSGRGCAAGFCMVPSFHFGRAPKCGEISAVRKKNIVPHSLALAHLLSTLFS